MFKVLKVLTTVALLTVASVVDAAPLMPGEPDAFEEPDPGRTDADIEINTALLKQLSTKTLTTFPDGDGKTVVTRALDDIITATSSPNIRDKSLNTGISNLLNTLTMLSDAHEETGSHDGSPENKKLMEITEKSDPDPPEELLKMLSALEELHKLMNSHRITIITRGNGNGRSTGKKNKMVVTDGNLKSTPATTIDSGGISPKASTDQMDPKLNGKSFKKSLPSTKKTNKRVCFWKYCSQN
ncbi:urotensin II-related peptide [Danio aesculapii]|uniref:urotensin II-related peptide n=1 Tax=Danio aesculapii TaxID=1142201 RepID=UPI0024C06C4E|nr:urotensin II-related peptide [Danio aesculapii]